MIQYFLRLQRNLKKDGIKLLNTTDFSSALMTPEGILTEERLSENEWKDIAFGWKMAKEMGRLDIGADCCCERSGCYGC